MNENLKRKTVDLTAASIDEISKLIAELLAAKGMEGMDVTRLRMSVEDVMHIWAEALGEGARCNYSYDERFGKASISLTVPGARVDPRKQEDALFKEGQSGINMLEALGLCPVYSYSDGQNRIAFPIKKKRRSGVKGMLVSIAAAVVLGLLINLLPSSSAAFLNESLFTPLLNAFFRCLSFIAGPMMALSVAWSIYNIGDIAMLGRIGKKLIGRCMCVLLLCTVFAVAANIGFYGITQQGGADGQSAVGSIFNMLLNIIPANIIDPFLTGNILQVVFISACVGLAMLVLSSKVSVVASVIDQLGKIVSLLMSYVSLLVPGFIFLSVLNMICSESAIGFDKTIGFCIECLVTGLVLGSCFLFSFSVRLRRKPADVFKSILPTFLITLSTASSTAAYATNVTDCINGLGIDKKLANFGVPMCMVIFKVASAMMDAIIALFMAKQYGLPITLSFLVTVILMAVILSVATPTIPGGDLTVFAVLFAQLGIPAEAIALSATMHALLDFPLTAINNFCAQMELGIVADKLGLMRRS